MVPYFRILPLTNEVVMLKIVQSDEEINSNGGLALVKGLLDANPAMRQWDPCFRPPPRPSSGPPTSSAAWSG